MKDKQVLIIDDSLTVRMHLKEALERDGFRVIARGTAREARAELARGKIELILLDVNLPDQDGVELLGEIRQSEYTAKTPVIILSSEAEVRDRIRGLKIGAQDYVGKPYDLSYVITKARELTGSGNAVKEGTVLVIDDSLTMRRELDSELSKRGYRVLTASSGEEGLKLAALYRPELLIVDGSLPGISGSTVIRKLRMDPALWHTPCMLLTASTVKNDQLEALDAGADAYVRKDEGIEQVMARLAALRRSAYAKPTGDLSPSLFVPKRVLGIGLDDGLREEVTNVLSEHGYEIAVANGIQDGLELLKLQPIDCILLRFESDSVQCGYECERIKNDHVARRIPLIVISNVADSDFTAAVIRAGADDFISVSDGMDVLRARVHAQIRRKQFEEENRRATTEHMLRQAEVEKARVARELAEIRARLLADLERKNAELTEARARAERESQFKSDLVAVVSHDLKNPLTAVDLKANLLLRFLQADDSRAREQAESIRVATRRMRDLIDGILDVSKIEAGELQIQKAPVTTEELFGEAFEMLMPLAKQKGVTLEKRVEAGAERLYCDHDRILQVISNLVGNAIKFTNSGGSVSVVARAGKGETLLEVSDTGVGIAREQLTHVFDRYWQAEKTAKKGSGLGLYISKGIVESHGGTIRASSEPGKGTRIFFSLPMPGEHSVLAG